MWRRTLPSRADEWQHQERTTADPAFPTVAQEFAVERPSVAKRHLMVAVGFNPRMAMTRERFVAERRLNVWRRQHAFLGRPIVWRWFDRRSATKWFGVIADRGVKPTATISGRSATKDKNPKSPGLRVPECCAALGAGLPTPPRGPTAGLLEQNVNDTCGFVVKDSCEQRRPSVQFSGGVGRPAPSAECHVVAENAPFPR